MWSSEIHQIPPRTQTWRQRLRRLVLVAQSQGHGGGDHVQQQNPERDTEHDKMKIQPHTIRILCQFTGDQKKVS